MVLINHSCFTVLYNNSVLYLSKFGNLHAYSILPKPKATPLVPWNGRGICSICKTIRFLTTFHKDEVLLLLWRWDEIQSQSQMKFDNFGSGTFFCYCSREGNAEHATSLAPLALSRDGGTPRVLRPGERFPFPCRGAQLSHSPLAHYILIIAPMHAFTVKTWVPGAQASCAASGWSHQVKGLQVPSEELQQQEPKVCKHAVTNGFVMQGFFPRGHPHERGFQPRAWKSNLPSQAVSIMPCLLFLVLFCPWLAWLRCPNWHGRVCSYPASREAAVLLLVSGSWRCACAPACDPDPSIYCIYPAGNLQLG